MRRSPRRPNSKYEHVRTGGNIFVPAGLASLGQVLGPKMFPPVGFFRMSLMPTLILLMAIGVVLIDAGIVVTILALFNRGWHARIIPFIQERGRLIIFLLALASIVGTLLMQYAGALNPCLLCWWQRIFMYPIAIISLIAIIKNTSVRDIADYVLWLSIPGALVALYQHLLQVLPSGALIPCDASGDCAVRSVFEFHFVTIPWMALTVFLALIVIALIARRRA